MTKQPFSATAFVVLAIVLCGAPLPAQEPLHTQETASRFAVRGTLPWHNFLSGPTAWNEEDYRVYLDRLVELGINFVAFHCYTGGAERYVTYVEPMIRIEYRNVVPEASFDTSLTARWGYRPLAVEGFAFGTSKLYPRPEDARAFGARCAVLARNKEDRYRRAQDLMRKVLKMAHERDIEVAMGFEFGIHPPEFASVVPPDSRIRGALLPDPTHPASIAILQATIDDVLRAYPDIDWIWLWLHEHTGYIGEARLSGRFRKLLERDGKLFRHAGDESAVFTGVWSLEYIRLAHAYLSKRAPNVRLAIGGWGGWKAGSQLPPVLRGLDRVLSRDIVFTCLNPGLGVRPHPPVLAEIAKHRPVWAGPWLESDFGLWHPQPRVSLMFDHVRLAHEQGLDGVFAIHWRTEETRANLEAFSQCARDPKNRVSVEDFYRRDCREQYGSGSVAELAPLLARMDREHWLNKMRSEEYYPYSPLWGRCPSQLRERLQSTVEMIERTKARTDDARHQANLNWLAENFRFTLLLDEVGRKIEPAYRLKQDWLAGRIDPHADSKRIQTAGMAFRSAPLELLLKSFARRVRSRGELGVLSSLNQKLWLQYEELDRFLLMMGDGK